MLADQLTEDEIKTYRPFRFHVRRNRRQIRIGFTFSWLAVDHWRFSFDFGPVSIAATYASFAAYKLALLQLGLYRNS